MMADPRTLVDQAILKMLNEALRTTENAGQIYDAQYDDLDMRVAMVMAQDSIKRVIALIEARPEAD